MTGVYGSLYGQSNSCIVFSFNKCLQRFYICLMCDWCTWDKIYYEFCCTGDGLGYCYLKISGIRLALLM